MSTSQTIHELDATLLAKPLKNRLTLALDVWQDLYPSCTSIRYGLNREDKTVYICENMYGPRLKVMTSEEDSEYRKLSYKYLVRDEDNENYIIQIAKKRGIHVKDWMNLTLDTEIPKLSTTSKTVQRNLNYEVSEFINYLLNDVGCKTHRCELVDGNVQWKRRDKFAKEVPSIKVWKAALEAIEPGSPIYDFLSWDGKSKTVDVKKCPVKAWEPMPQTEVELTLRKIRDELQDPENPWVKARTKDPVAPDRVELYPHAYAASKFPIPLTRHGMVLFDGARVDYRTDNYIGYIRRGTESCGFGGIDRDIEELYNDARNGRFSLLSLCFSKLPDILMSDIYYAQVRALQKERADFESAQPLQDVKGGDVMPKAVTKLKVGDQVGVDHPGCGWLWCDVTKKEGDVLTLFVNNGHWDFKLNVKTNKSLPHEVISDFEGLVSVTYTANNPYKDPALYDKAITYMDEHAKRERAKSEPALTE